MIGGRDSLVFPSLAELIILSSAMASTATTDCVDLATLESYLWEAGHILRGPVDASDLKIFIFPLLFSKRISDVYDEEYEQALTESGGGIAYAQFAENHRFQVPEGCHLSVSFAPGKAIKPQVQQTTARV